MKTLKLFLLMTTVINSEVWAMHNQFDEDTSFNKTTQSLKLNNSQKIDPDDIESIITAANKGDKESQDVVVSLFYDDLFTDEIKEKAKITLWKNLYENAMTDYKFANLVIGITEFQDFDNVPEFQSYMQETYMTTDSNEKNYIRGRMYERGWNRECEKSKIKASTYYRTSQEFPVSIYRYANLCSKENTEEELLRKPILRNSILDNYKLAAEKGYIAAQRKLALMYKVAAKEGNDQAIQRIVEMYREGQAVDCSVEEWKLIAERAERGGAAVHYILGKMYENGENNAPEDIEEAARWYKKAAEAANDQAIQRIVEMYYKGQTPYYTVNDWEEIAERGGAAVHYILAKMYENGENNAPEDIEEAAKWYKMAAEVGNDQAIQRIVEMYHEGHPQVLNYPIQLWEEIAERGGADVHYILGKIFETDMKNPTKALECYERAAQQGNKDAQNNLGKIYLSRGEKAKAVEFFIEASDRGHADAQNELGKLYLMGSKQIPRNHKEAKALFEKAYAQSHLDATNRLAWMYYNGQECAERNEVKAIELWRQARERGSEHARLQLAKLSRDYGVEL